MNKTITTEILREAEGNYLTLCVAQKKAIKDAPNEEKRNIAKHYSEGLKDGYIECLKDLKLLDGDDATALEMTGVIYASIR